MRLFLHAGIQRTATTSIQGFLGQRRADLAARGVLVPFGVVRHDGVTRRLISGDLTAEALADQIEAEARAQAVGVTSVVISDEDLCGLPDFGVLAGLARRFDLRVLVALRRQDLWLESWYLQNVKWQWNPLLCHLTPEDFVARRAEFGWLHYDRLLDGLAKVVGRDAVRASVFDAESAPVAAFAERIGLEGLATGGESLANAATSPLTGEFLRRLPLDAVEPEERAILEAAVIGLDRRLGPGSSRLILDHGLRAAILQDYAAGNEAVAQRWFDGQPLFAPLPGPDAPLAERHFPPEAEALIARYVAPLIEELGEAMTRARLKRRRAEKA